ncbi:putative alpha/beta hydrolase family esterase [Microbacterium testaceum]|nr:putative alpha/beta hydrolase family esterase [Microbacterium sp. SORGH_AS_0969]MDQ1117345.1 putative alpha/beta hydrolase family esterase [Microbacterium testaceum]
MVAYVIVPGIGGSGEQHWQTHWERRWGRDARRVEPRSWDEPDLDDWVDAVDRCVTDLARQTDRVIVVAHSLGCWAATEWDARTGDQRQPERVEQVERAPVTGMLLVAPPDPTGDAFPRAAAPSFVGLAVRPLACPTTVVASSDDPYCSVEVAQGLASGWGSTLRNAGALGHLNAASGLGEWAWGRAVLGDLVRA